MAMFTVPVTTVVTMGLTIVVTGVLATHHHPDHVGGDFMGFSLPGLAELLARQQVPVHVNDAESEWVRRVTGVSDSDLVAHAHDDLLEVAGGAALTRYAGPLAGAAVLVLVVTLVLRRRRR